MKIPFVSSDLFNDAMSVAYVPQIQIIYDFKGIIDPQIVRKSILLLIKLEPKLGSKIVDNFFKPYWKQLPDNILNSVKPTLVNTDESTFNKHSEQFLAQKMDHRCDPLISSLILSDSAHESGRLILKISHMVVDARGTKEIGYLFTSIYNALLIDPDYVPAPIQNSYSLSQIYSNISIKDSLNIARRYFRDIKAAVSGGKSFHYPAINDNTGEIEFVIKTCSPEITKSIKDLANKYSCTVNDVMLCALLYGVKSKTEYIKGDTLRLMGTIDLRKYIKNDSIPRLANLSSFFFINFEDPLTSFVDTLKKIKENIDFIKSDFMGLGWVAGSWLLIAPHPFAIGKKLLQNGFKTVIKHLSAGLSLTNFGKIDATKMEINGLQINNVSIIAPACVPPVFFMGLSGYKDTLTLSIGFNNASMERHNIESVVSNMFNSIKAI